MGRVPVALLNDMDFMHGESKRKLVRIARDLLLSLIPFQHAETGLLYEVIDKGGQPGNWLKTSRPYLYAVAICKAVRTGVLDTSCLSAEQKAVTGVTDRLQYDGETC